MQSLLRFSGVMGQLFFISAILFLHRSEKEFSLHRDAYSYFGIDKITQKIFNLVLILYACLRLLFLANFVHELNAWENVPLGISAVGGPLALAFVALVPWNKRELLHNFFAYAVAILTIAFLILSGLLILPASPVLAAVGFILSLLTITSTAYVYVKDKVTGLYQIFFYANCMVWDWLLTYYLLMR